MGPRRLEFISDPRARKATFQKRSRGILKKAKELAILCSTDVCVSSSALGDPHSTSVLWPPEPSEVERILARFRASGKKRRNVVGVRKKKMDPPSSSSSFLCSSSAAAADGGTRTETGAEKIHGTRTETGAEKIHGTRTETGAEKIQSLRDLKAKIAEVAAMVDQLRKGKEKEEQQPPLSELYQDPYFNFDLGRDMDFDFDSLQALMGSEEEPKWAGDSAGSLVGSGSTLTSNTHCWFDDPAAFDNSFLLSTSPGRRF